MPGELRLRLGKAEDLAAQTHPVALILTHPEAVNPEDKLLFREFLQEECGVKNLSRLRQLLESSEAELAWLTEKIEKLIKNPKTTNQEKFLLERHQANWIDLNRVPNSNLISLYNGWCQGSETYAEKKALEGLLPKTDELLDKLATGGVDEGEIERASQGQIARLESKKPIELKPDMNAVDNKTRRHFGRWLDIWMEAGGNSQKEADLKITFIIQGGRIKFIEIYDPHNQGILDLKGKVREKVYWDQFCFGMGFKWTRRESWINGVRIDGDTDPKKLAGLVHRWVISNVGHKQVGVEKRVEESEYSKQP